MKILAIEKEVRDTTKEQFAPHLKEEAKRVFELKKAGVVREIYFGQQFHNVVMILECDNEAGANEILNTLPLVREKLIKFELTTLIPYDGFDRLNL